MSQKNLETHVLQFRPETERKTHSPQNPKRPFATRLVAGKRSRIELVDTHSNHVSCLASGDYADPPVKLILAELDS